MNETSRVPNKPVPAVVLILCPSNNYKPTGVAEEDHLLDPSPSHTTSPYVHHLLYTNTLGEPEIGLYGSG